MKNFGALLRCAALVALFALMAGCATSKAIWTPRVGVYTFDQAVLEYGPPDKQAKLQDGTVVADWLLRRSYRYINYSPVFDPGPYGYYGPYFPAYSETTVPDYFLRLVFGPDGKLSAWKNFIR